MILRPEDDFYASRDPGPDDVLHLIEVSETSLPYDLGEKLRLYARYGVREYWVLDVGGDRIEVFRAPDGEAYTEHTTHRRGEPITPLAFPDVPVDPDEILP